MSRWASRSVASRESIKYYLVENEAALHPQRGRPARHLFHTRMSITVSVISITEDAKLSAQTFHLSCSGSTSVTVCRPCGVEPAAPSIQDDISTAYTKSWHAVKISPGRIGDQILLLSPAAFHPDIV